MANFSQFFFATAKTALPLELQQLQPWNAVILTYLVRKLDLSNRF
jgi:hypothetical protein